MAAQSKATKPEPKSDPIPTPVVSDDEVLYYDQFWPELGNIAREQGLSLSRSETTTGGRISHVLFQTFTAPDPEDGNRTSLVGEFEWHFSERPLNQGIFKEATASLGLAKK